MNFFTLLQAAGAAQQPGGGMSFWIMMIAIVAVMYFFMIRPQRKQQKELEKFRSELKKGDKVVTAGGIFGTIAEIQERSVLIKVDGEVKLRVDKNSIVRDYSEAQSSGEQPQQK
ncbi:MAG: preprotein translocase subunit YajC [Bacteroidales bacterium]|nr:preprotein translocase subunit YajC [Bacteroidales bacterium]